MTRNLHAPARDLDGEPSDCVLVTGCAGFIGSHLSRFLLNEGVTVVGVDDLSGGYVEWLPTQPRFNFVRADLNDTKTVDNIFSTFNPSTVFHLAAYASEGLSPYVRRFNYTNNLLATMSLVNAAIQHDAKMVFASSMAVYGSQVPPFTETMRPQPMDPYGIAKFACEQDIQVAGEQHNLRWSIFRPHNVVGIRQNIWDRYRNVLGIFVRRGLDHQPLLVFGDGSQQRAFSSVEYLLAPLARLTNQGDSQIYNLGSDRPVTILRLAELVQASLATRGIDVEIQHVEARHEVKDAFSSHEKAINDLNFHDETDLTLTIDQVIAWAITEPTREIKSLDYEVTRKLYSYWT